MVFCNESLDIDFDDNDSGHNPYFNRWFSAIFKMLHIRRRQCCHNPYFNRWFSAIKLKRIIVVLQEVTILILIDGFLQ